jgi:integration host factor subunit beta
MHRMNKNDMARTLSQQFGFSGREAGLIVDRFFNALSRELKAGRRVELRGLGTFEVRSRKPGMGRVLKTGAFVPVPALRRVFFRPGKDLKEITVRSHA